MATPGYSVKPTFSLLLVTDPKLYHNQIQGYIVDAPDVVEDFGGEVVKRELAASERFSWGNG